MKNQNPRPKSNKAQIIIAICAVITILLGFWGNLISNVKNNVIEENKTIDNKTFSKKKQDSLDEYYNEFFKVKKEIIVKDNPPIIDTIIDLNKKVTTAIAQILRDTTYYSESYEYLKNNKHFELADKVLKLAKKRTIQKPLIEDIENKKFVLDFIHKHNYDDAWYDNNQNIIIVIKNEKYGFFDLRKNIEIFEPKFSALDIFFDGSEMFKVKYDELWGLINWKGQLIFDCIFENIENKYSILIVNDNGKLGVLNKKGKIITEPQYTTIERLWTNTFLIEKNNKWGLLNNLGKEKLSPKYDTIKEHYVKDNLEPMIYAVLDGERYYLDLNGNIVK